MEHLSGMPCCSRCTTFYALAEYRPDHRTASHGFRGVQETKYLYRNSRPLYGKYLCQLKFVGLLINDAGYHIAFSNSVACYL